MTNKPEMPEDLSDAAEKLANSMYEPHRFGDTPAWFGACVKLAMRYLAEKQRAETAEARLATAREFMRHKCTCALFRGSETNTRPVAEKICDCGYVTALAATDDKESK